jgi:hypothetical protein
MGFKYSFGSKKRHMAAVTDDLELILIWNGFDETHVSGGLAVPAHLSCRQRPIKTPLS